MRTNEQYRIERMKSVCKSDMIDRKFGKLYVISEVGKNKHNHIIYQCLCDCGTICDKLGYVLRSGKSSSCGCFRKELFRTNVGSKNSNFKPEITDEERIKRKEHRYTYDNQADEWRKLVFQRDNYKCRKCKNNARGQLRAHHIENWSTHKDKRYIVDNGITLCVNCHKSFHSKFGIKNNSRLQLNTFLIENL